MARKAIVMNPATKAVEATVRPVESEHPHGEFEVILATDDLDRDGENLWADEWQTPLPDKVHFDTDHAFNKGMSVPLTAGSAKPEINEDGQIVCRGVYAGTEHGQLVRQLVNEGHVWQASAAFIEHKSADGHVTRELLNATFTGVPANPEAVVTSSKAAKGDGPPKPYGNVRYADPANGKYPIDTEEHVRAAWSYVNMPKNAAKYNSSELSAIKGRIRSAARRFGIEIGDEKALLVAVCKAVVAASDTGAASVYDEETGETAPDDEEAEGENAAAQAVHDAAVALGAQCDGCTVEKSYHTASVVSLQQKAAGTAAGAATEQVPAPPAEPPAHLAAAHFDVRKFELENLLHESEMS